MLVANGIMATLEYSNRYANSLDAAALMVRFFDGVPRLPGLAVWEEPRKHGTWKFTFQLVGPGRTACPLPRSMRAIFRLDFTF
jgi:hypothetical protein